MLQEAADRIAPLVGSENVYIATASHLADPIRSAGIVPDLNVLAEPDKRNTLGCLCWVAAQFLARGIENPSIAILTADHIILEPDLFRSTVDAALSLAEETKGLVTMGISPTRPETGYGYIEGGKSLESESQRVLRFREKPDLATAQSFLEQGNFYWNSGMFFWTLDSFLSELSAAEPEAVQVIRNMAAALRSGDDSLAMEEFRSIRNLSIDYALMEKATDVFVVKAEFPWDDVGAFDSLMRTMPTDENGNVLLGRVFVKDCKNCILYNDSSSGIMSVVGLNDVIMVQTDDIVMAAPLSDAQRVKELVGMITESSYL